MFRQHHQLNGHEFKQTPGKSYGKKSLVDYSTWGPKESEVTEVTEHTQTDAETEAQVLWLLDMNSQLIGKDPDAGKH